MSFEITLQDLLEAGAHYGHQAGRWNPKMRPFIYDARNGVHIINLAVTLAYAEDAYNKVVEVVSQGGSVLFVGTKPQAREPLKAAAAACEQSFMVHRWLGGTLTNLRTMRKSVEKIRKLQDMEADGTFQLMTKKEALTATRERDKLLQNLEGIMDLKRSPGIVFVVDVGHDYIAVEEANKLNIPVIGLCDTNSDPANVDLPIPANDDAVRSIRLFADMVAIACKEGEAKRQEILKAEEDESEQTESLADSFIGAEEEEELLTMRTVIKKIKKADDAPVEPAAGNDAKADDEAKADNAPKADDADGEPEAEAAEKAEEKEA